MRRLTLKREALAELTTPELAAVAGAYRPLPTQDCTGYYPSLNAPCSLRECIEIRQTPLCPTEI
ncbi:MAG TPA: hypothetical protein VF519_04990 [Mycobacteriales bacterium]|jgi:hypothetical protein